MKESRYDLHIKVPSATIPNQSYVVRRRVIDGGYECSCPRWVQQRAECRHVRPIAAAMASVPRRDPLASKIKSAVKRYPYFIHDEDLFIEHLLKELRR